MKPLFPKVFYYEPPLGPDSVPPAGKTYPVTDGVWVDVVRIESYIPDVGFDSLPLAPHPQDPSVFFVDNPGYEASKNHHIRIGFLKPNFLPQGSFALGGSTPRIL